MKVTFGTMTITDNAKRYVNQALNTGRITSGVFVQEFERKYADLVGARYGVAVSTGTDADTLALAVLYDFGAKRGDEVIVPALSFVATGNAVLHAGFTPVFVDIKRETLNIDVDKIEAAISPKTRAIMPVHLMGKPAEMDRINEIAKKHKLIVIEDAAEAHGGEYKGKLIGQWGDMAAYSLYAAHIISTVEGGIVTTDNAQYADILRSLRSHGRFCKCEQCVMSSGAVSCEKRFHDGKDLRFFFERVGYSSKMNELEAAVGLGNLEIYRETLDTRYKNLKYLLDRFDEFSPQLFTIKEESHEKIGPHAFPIIVGPNESFSKDELASFLSENGIDSRSMFLSMPTQCPGFAFLDYKLGEFMEAEYVADHGIHIGVHQDLTQEHMEYVLTTIRKFLDKQK